MIDNRTDFPCKALRDKHSSSSNSGAQRCALKYDHITALSPVSQCPLLCCLYNLLPPSSKVIRGDPPIHLVSTKDNLISRSLIISAKILFFFFLNQITEQVSETRLCVGRKAFSSLPHQPIIQIRKWRIFNMKQPPSIIGRIEAEAGFQTQGFRLSQTAPFCLYRIYIDEIRERESSCQGQWSHGEASIGREGQQLHKAVGWRGWG